ncbi:uncharacterized protein LOC118771457 [Megalops cyprinoides]|uniref:uncharacterized protein LOC118771457 n=1 Tax=Megalops cyprinoides TaxID=118141 RepID=UPI001864F461|nr:uncharacterized protein LOC118771457 [Megalops cyprinoides]
MGHLTFLCGVLLALSLVSVSGRPEDILKKIQDLEGKDFGHNYPRHGLNLLYWFAHEYITFDNNNNIQSKQDPKEGVFGFHYFGNKEAVFPSLRNQRGYNYYAVGNLFDSQNLPESQRLPDYVTEEFRSSKNLDSRDQNNRDRIVVRRTPYGSIDEVYVTQHYDFSAGHGSQYDPDNTFRISSDLLKDIRNLPRDKFLKPFPPRARTHYALCHPDRGSGQEVRSDECNHKFSKANCRPSLSSLMCLCCVVSWLLIGFL